MSRLLQHKVFGGGQGRQAPIAPNFSEEEDQSDEKGGTKGTISIDRPTDPWRDPLPLPSRSSPIVEQRLTYGDDEPHSSQRSGSPYRLGDRPSEEGDRGSPINTSSRGVSPNGKERNRINGLNNNNRRVQIVGVPPTDGYFTTMSESDMGHFSSGVPRADASSASWQKKDAHYARSDESGFMRSAAPVSAAAHMDVRITGVHPVPDPLGVSSDVRRQPLTEASMRRQKRKEMAEIEEIRDRQLAAGIPTTVSPSLRRRSSPSHGRRSPAGRHRSTPNGTVSFVNSNPRAQSPLNHSTTLWRDDPRTGRPMPVSTGPQVVSSAEIDRLREELRQKTAQLELVQRENSRFRDRLDEKEVQLSEVVERFTQCQNNLGVAVGQLHEQQNQIAKLKHTLTGEICDNDALKNGFMNLLRTAQKDLRTVRDEIRYNQRGYEYSFPQLSTDGGVGGLVPPRMQQQKR